MALLHEDVRHLLTSHGYERIFKHSRMVSLQAAELAARFGADEDKAGKAGLLHDIGVIVPNEERARFLELYGVEVFAEERVFPLIMHQRVSRVLAETLFKIKDEVILSAVGCHTTLKPGSSDMDKILFVADKLRWDQPGIPPYRDAVLNGLESSLKCGAFAYVEYLFENKQNLKVIHPWLMTAYNDMLQSFV